MIYTLTLNPAIDQMIAVNIFTLGITNKAISQYQIIGGKGINVSVMLKKLGYENIALGFIGSDNQKIFENYLEEEKITSIFHTVKGPVRINLKIKSITNSVETELNCLGFNTENFDEKKIFELIQSKLTNNDTLIMAGSLPSGCNKNIYKKIAEYCFKTKITFAIDTTKVNLLDTLKFQPLLVKPNLLELNEIFNSNYDFSQVNEIVKLGQKLIVLGAKNVLISNGKAGSILVTKEYAYFVNSAQGELVNSVGAGDSMVAGFIGTYLATKDAEQALIIASAAGASTAFSQGIGSLELIKNLKKQIKITKII